jgi:hypothetical protein
MAPIKIADPAKNYSPYFFERCRQNSPYIASLDSNFYPDYFQGCRQSSPY